jgi:uncharacterized protein (TIGR02145 family)
LPIRIRGLAVALSLAFAAVVGACTNDSSKQMPDGKQWTVDNLNVSSDHSYCFENAEENCRRYGRLYTWESAQQGCRSLSGGWRLPTKDDWQRLARHVGGAPEDSDDSRKAAYAALTIGGRSGFNAMLGGNRNSDGRYARLEAHGFYWTASESSSSTAWFYNFGKGGLALYSQREGDKQMAISVRCVKE